jgi:hypothetical protein
MNKNITIIKKLKDDKYQNDHSQVDEETRNIHKWPKWYWGLGSDGELYFKGQISGYWCPNWTKKSEALLPLSTEEICRLSDFIRFYLNLV